MARIIPAAGLTLVTLFSGTVAFADVGAGDVWTDLQTYMKTIGYTVSTDSEEMSGDTLVVSGLSAYFAIDSLDLGETDGVQLDIDELRFRELSNGSVEISMSDEHTVTITGGESMNNLNLVLTTNQTGLSIIAGGSVAETSYDIVAEEMSITTTTFEVDGEPVDANIAVTLANYTGGYTHSSSDLTAITGEGRIDSVDITAFVSEPQEEVRLNLSSQIEDLSVTMDTSLPEKYDPADLSAALAQGFAGSGTYTMGSFAIDLSGQIESEEFTLVATTGIADLSLSMSDAGFSFAEHARDLEVALSTSSMPLPQLVLTAAEYGLNLLLPVTPSPDLQDFGFGLRLVDLNLPENLWQLGDPAGALPHTPLTVVVETSGTSRLMGDPFDSEEMSDGTVPAELDTFALDDLHISAVGTELTGGGGFAFDNTDMTSFDGFPRPEGRVDLRLTGANTLIDTLISMGLLPEDQAMGARMMLGLFAVAGPGEDELTSTIEINAEGHILANGQRLR